MDAEYIRPSEIEKRSFEILTAELTARGIILTGDTASVIKRCIHTTADFDYAETMRFSDDAVQKLKELIRSGAFIVTDTNMALSGISKKEFAKYGGKLFCFMAEEDVAKEASERKITRASVSMEKAMRLEDPVIFVIGNAPTALITLHEHYTAGTYTPAFVIGVPVGFVNVEAAKELIMDSGIPYIVNKGRKGGSNVAAAIVNAVLYQMRDEPEDGSPVHQTANRSGK
ncbi:MAG: precorrin-8X methylmutase [Lachnospiraceae bacterium]|nr:precorrin-8X methylmutase [Lachnospiraceae bacterium]